jgi:hypothetical protein
MGKVGMTPTPWRKRRQAEKGVFAGPLDRKKQRQGATAPASTPLADLAARAELLAALEAEALEES